MLYIERRIEFQHKDERGYLIQLIHDGYKQVNVLKSKAGAVRGTHFHKYTHEAFYLISGIVKVDFIAGNERDTVIFQGGAFFEVPPFVLHKLLFLEDSLMIQLYDNPVEKNDGSKDIYMEDEFDA